MKTTGEGAGKAQTEANNLDEAAYNPYVSLYSLTLSALQLVELHDHYPGREQRIKTLDELAKQFYQFTPFAGATE